MAKKIKVLLKRVDQDAEVVEIDGSLQSMQELVGGYIEGIQLGDGLVLCCDETGG